jgi:hypothetical protein
MRVGPVAVAVAALLAGACSNGDGRDFVTRETSTSAGPGPASTTVPPAPSTTTTAVAAGAVTLRVTGLTLPDVGAGGSGLRILVRSSSEQLTVRRGGGEGGVSVCAIAFSIPSPNDGPCPDLPAGGAVDVPFRGGVELRAMGARATLNEVTVIYVPVTRATTLVTPARPAGACQAACEATFALVPGGAGAFVLTGQGGGGRPRLVLTSVGAGVSNRTLATVEGGGSLSIRASVEAGSEARLLHHEEGSGPIAPVTMEILWP